MTENINKLNTTSWQHKRGTIGKVVIGSEDIKQCINNIINIQKGSIPFMPELGTNIIAAIGEKANDAIDIAVAIFSKEIPIQEPRVEIISTSGEYTESGEIHITIQYREKQSGISDYTEVYL